ncbi:hypothetical protein [Lapidilactobacillus bayanensis]|uniref:hypothetical protein n=1 Tax=Lapidilactobacillus bayanensis TaxID=2485998 RepID=UPI000F7B4013|nr:hypothetical protein [Lapidilactobacillus bayanensis]
MSENSDTILEAVRSIESDYGTLENAPYDDPRFNIPREIYKEDKLPTGRKPTLSSELIKNLWAQGFTDDKIIGYIEENQDINVSLSTIRKARQKFGNPNKLVWLLTRGLQRTIIPTNDELAEFLRFKTHGVNKEQLIERAKQDGWIITRIVSHDY